MRVDLTEEDLRDLATCDVCLGTRNVPDIFGDYDLCDACAVLPRDAQGDSDGPL
jgi:hypothetical protein